MLPLCGSDIAVLLLHCSRARVCQQRKIDLDVCRGFKPRMRHSVDSCNSFVSSIGGWIVTDGCG